MSIWAQKTSKWHKSVNEFFFVAPRNGTPQSFCASPKEMLFTHPGICKNVSEMSEEFMQFGHTKHPLLQIVCGWKISSLKKMKFIIMVIALDRFHPLDRNWGCHICSCRQTLLVLHTSSSSCSSLSLQHFFWAKIFRFGWGGAISGKISRWVFLATKISEEKSFSNRPIMCCKRFCSFSEFRWCA